MTVKTQHGNEDDAIKTYDRKYQKQSTPFIISNVPFSLLLLNHWSRCSTFDCNVPWIPLNDPSDGLI